MTCHIQETSWHECNHRLSEVTHSHVCPLFRGVDQHVSSEGPARCRNIRTRLAIEAGRCALCDTRDSGENLHLLSRLDRRLPPALIEEHHAEFAPQMLGQIGRDLIQSDPRAGWHAEQELNRLLQEEDGVSHLDQTYVFDPEHHPESSRFLEKARGLKEPCPVCRVPTSESGDARRLPCGHGFHYKCIVPWFLDLVQSRCPTCSVEFHIIRAPAFDEETPKGDSGESMTTPLAGLSFSERAADLRWRQSG